MSWTSNQPGLGHLQPPPGAPITPPGTPAPLPPRIVAATLTVGHPTEGDWHAGQAIVDANGILWYCIADGQPGTWAASTTTGVSSFNGRTGAVTPAAGDYITIGTTPGAPTTGTWTAGSIYIDTANVLYVCTAGGTPGTWTCPRGQLLATYNDNSTSTSSVPLTASAWVSAIALPTFTVPPSGNIRVVASGGVFGGFTTSPANISAGILNAGTLYQNASQNCGIGYDTTSLDPPMHLDVILTGLTPRTSPTLNLGVYSSEAGNYYWGGTAAQANGNLTITINSA